MPAGRNSGVAGTSSTARTAVPPDLPGADLVSAGIEALRRGDRTVEALLVMVGARRMGAAGLDIPPGLPLERYPEHALYAAVAVEHPDDAHSRYNALVRRLVSFERALEAVSIPSERRGNLANAHPERGNDRLPRPPPATLPSKSEPPSRTSLSKWATRWLRGESQP